MNTAELYSLFLNSAGVATDTRSIKKGQIFFALKGENFNGNEYVQKALEAGASYAITDEIISNNNNIIKVENVLKSMQELAAYHRERLDIPIIAITGTNGKTTTKELISNVLSKKYKLTYTQGNFNNHIGVPLTLLSFKDDTEIAVVEMGANHQGEIKALCEIAKPNFGLITNIGKAHLEGFGSFDKVVETKLELYNYLKKSPKSKVFYNADDNLLEQNTRGLNTISYGMNGAADTNVKFLKSDIFLQVEWKDNEINTQLVGNYNFDNISAAICVGEYFNVPETLIIEALSEYKPQNNRSQLLKTDKRNTLIIDAYNANPESMRLSVNNFSNFKAINKVLIIGDMLELGKMSKKEHQAILQFIENAGFETVFAVGREFYALRNDYPQFSFMYDTDELCTYLSHQNWQDKTILLKASRGIKLEKTIQYF